MYVAKLAFLAFSLYPAVLSSTALPDEKADQVSRSSDARIVLEKPTSAPETLSSTVPINPRTSEGTTYLTRAEKVADFSRNFTFFPTIGSDQSQNITTTTSIPRSSSVDESKPVDFKPSVHIGEIDEYETEISSDVDNPSFSNNQRINFVNTVDELADTDGVRVPTSTYRESERTRVKKVPSDVFGTDGRYGAAVPMESLHHHHRHKQQRQHQQQEYYYPQQVELQFPVQQSVHTDENNDVDQSNHNHGHYYHPQSDMNYEMPMHEAALVTYVYPRPPGYMSVNPKPPAMARPVYQTIAVEHQSPNQYYEPSVQTVYVKPSKFHGETMAATVSAGHGQHYEQMPPASGEAMDKPKMYAHHHDEHRPGNYQEMQDGQIPEQNFGKPETVLYVTSHRQTAFTQTQKFPYKFYEPSVGGHHDDPYHYIREGQHGYPSKDQRVSPWKRIIHLIGAFLPLGLLLATLKPSIVNIENTTQPNIVLSKLRLADMKAEHKNQPGSEDVEFEQDACSAKSICELIVSGSEPTANVLQNMLWNLTKTSTYEEAQAHGLREIFEAAKKKDCSSLDC